MTFAAAQQPRPLHRQREDRALPDTAALLAAANAAIVVGFGLPLNWHPKRGRLLVVSWSRSSPTLGLQATPRAAGDSVLAEATSKR